MTYRHLIGLALTLSCRIPIIPFSSRTLSPAPVKRRVLKGRVFLREGFRLPVFAGLQVHEVLASGNEVSLGRIAPGHALNIAKVCRVVVGVRRSFQVRDMEVLVLI